MASSDEQPVHAGTDAVPVDVAELERKHASGSQWFYWIAALSVVNSISLLSGGNWGFAIGLGITMMIDGIFQEIGKGAFASNAMAIGIDAVVIGVFALFGYFSGKGKTWAFYVGIVLYALDGLLFLMTQDLLSLGFHAFAIFFMWRGLQACKQLKAIGDLPPSA